MVGQENKRICWCNNTSLIPFSSDYEFCSVCGTLVSQQGLTEEQISVTNDNQDFYGKDYWFSHQIDEYGQPDIMQRSRQDIPERCLHWLRTLLKYKLPPAKVLELGSAHGGFVGLMQWAGFEATGLELSPWIVNYAKQTFDVPMLEGALEYQNIEPGSLDAIVLFDVLEHLDHPFESMQTAANLLKPDGIFIVQMPNYPDGKTYEEMVEEGDRFLEQMKAVEHLYLLSHRAAELFFNRLGFYSLKTEQELYSYDMFLVASRHSINEIDQKDIEKKLLSIPSSRMVLALIDEAVELEKLNSMLHDIRMKYYASESDRANRLNIIHKQNEDVSRLQATVQKLQQKIESQKVSYSEKIEQLTEKKKDLRKKAREVKTKLNLKNKENTLLSKEIDARQLELSDIKSSKLWKLKEYLLRFKKYFQGQ